jgi:7,8-dihydropterin-6-yl-methyl-4-(beta-D-ribofuranosyl)aminobenzene 5'-phosphate synthase
MISLSILAENTARGTGIIGEHGFSCWIDTGAHRVLFDTGQGRVFQNNAAQLEIDLGRADAIVLSHGHYDHTGGLEQALSLAPNARLFLHPLAVQPKFSGSGGRTRRISTGFMESEDFRAKGREVVMSREAREVVPGVWMTGEIPRANDFEDTGGPFFLDEPLRDPDPLLDDQALFFDTNAGLVVVLGCAHSGVVNTLRHVCALAGHSRIHALIGGLHLEAASARRMDETVAALKALAPERIGCCHCTGFQAMMRLWTEFPGRCFQAHAGLRMEFSPSPAQ